jgi:hypothetical protein
MPRLVLLSIQVEDSPEALSLGAASVAAALAGCDPASQPLLAAGLAIDLVEGRLSPGPSTTAQAAAQATARAAAQAEAPAAGLAEGLAAAVLGKRPDWVGFSVYSWNREPMVRLAYLLRAARPGLLLFCGGPEATGDPEGLVAEAPFDFLIQGEGEAATAAALETVLAAPAATGEGALSEAARRSLLGLPGLVLPGRPAFRGNRPALDLAGLPSPWLSGHIRPREGGVLWELARGCPFHCAYCYEGKGEEGLRRIPRARMEAELELFVSLGVSQAFVLDPTFDADKKRAGEVLDLIAKKARGIHWKFEIRAELVDRGLASKFAALDCSLQVGLQTADPRVSAACGRPLDLAAFKRGLGLLDAAGVVYGIDLIYGLPGDDPAGFAKSLDFALGLQPNHLDVFPLALLPGTELAARAGEFGIVAAARAPYLVSSTPGFSPEAMEGAALLASSCDLFYCRGRAVSWFLQVLRPLKTRPSSFLRRFGATVLEKAGGRAERPSSTEIEGLQLGFVEAEYRAKGLAALFPAARDLIVFNAAWGRALAEGVGSRIELSYPPDEILGEGALDLAAYARRARPRPGRFVVTPTATGPRLSKAGSPAKRGRGGAASNGQGGPSRPSWPE